MSPARGWSELPTELLDIIFKRIPRYSRSAVGDVCQHWRSVLHSQAVGYLATSIRKQQIEEQQLKRFGWSPEDHDVTSCSCIHIVFRLFSAETTHEYRYHRKNWSGGSWAVAADKVLVANLFCVSILNRLDTTGPPAEGRVLPHCVIQDGRDTMYSCGGDLLVIVQPVRDDKKRLLSYTASLWWISTETWLTELDLLAQTPTDVRRKLAALDSEELVSDVDINSSMLAVHIRGNFPFCVNIQSPIVTLFWRIDSSGSGDDQVKFITAVQEQRFDKDMMMNMGSIFINDSYFARYRLATIGDGRSDLVVREITASGAVLPAHRIVPVHQYPDGDYPWLESLRLEPGQSDRMFRQEFDKYS